MAVINGSVSGNGAEVDANGVLKTGLFDSAGNPIFKLKGGVYAPSTDRFLPLAGVNDGVFRPLRSDRFGSIATAKITPVINYQLYTGQLMPYWLTPVANFTVTHALATGTFLNSLGTGAIGSHASFISMKAAPKYQKAPLFSRHRARLVKGSTNGQADIGLSSSQSPLATVLTHGFVFLYGSDQTLKPTVYMNGAVIAQGTDFAAAISSAQYYVWGVIVDDDSATFICQDPSTGANVSEQTLTINAGDPRFGLSPYWFSHARSFVTSAAANVGQPTQVYVADATVGMLDVDAGKPWADLMAQQGQSTVINPTTALTQLANYANSAAPASATLSNIAAGYTTLGGQFQFAAVAGLETDYALFAFTVPAGLTLNVTEIDIDTINTGAAVATTPTWLQWFVGDAAAVTLASNSFRQALGNQVFPIAAAIGAQAAILSKQFRTPFVVNSGRIFHLGLKMPLGTATPAQIIRGVARIGGYFE